MSFRVNGRVELIGLPEFSFAVRAVSNKMGDFSRDLVHEGGTLLIQTAQSIVHVITGTLRDSIDFVEEGRGPGGLSAQAVVSSNAHGEAPYDIFEEFGTRYHGPHPFMAPAAAETAMEYEQLAAQLFDQAIHEVLAP